MTRPASPSFSVGSRTSSAPNRRASSIRPSIGSTASTRSAPASRANCTASRPIAPRPKTATRSPSEMPASRIASAITTGSRQSAASDESPAGNRSARDSSTVCVSRMGKWPNTRSPVRNRETSVPISVTTPTAMLPSGLGNAASASSGGHGITAPQAGSYGRLVTGSFRYPTSSVPCLGEASSVRMRIWDDSSGASS